MGATLYEKVFERHTVRELPSGQVQLLVGLHLLHEVTSPQAFDMLRARGLTVLAPERTFATIDHIVPTDGLRRPLRDEMAEEMLSALEQNVAASGIRYFSPARGEQGIVHVIGPELGITQPGMTICCGDSHTSTHGAFGAIAFGIGTSQVRDVLATQTLAISKLKVRRIDVTGRLRPGVSAKDVILHVINRLGVKGGVGCAYEYGGELIDALSMDERMTICNMSIEGGARCGYVNPDRTTYEYLRGRPFAPGPAAWDRAVASWESVRSDPDARYHDRVSFDGSEIEPMVTWGITPGQSVGVNDAIQDPGQFPPDERSLVEDAYEYMGLRPGTRVKGMKVDVAFIGSCTNSRLSDFEEVVRHIRGGGLRVAPHVRALVVPGSQEVAREMIRLGYDKVFAEAGFELREPGCSMCIAMNADKLVGREVCASSSNRNFKGRQGSPEGRTLLMSPLMVAAAAIAGEVADAREVFGASGPRA
jgi:3-isopropylmalate/(R)-2-methylmalate dehydratase large subunit